MPALFAAAAAVALAAADGPSRALPYDAIRDPVITGAAAAGWVLLHVLEDRLASETCRWCEPPPFDLSARGALRLQSSDTPATASDVVAYGAIPLAGLGVDSVVWGRDAKTAVVDALIAGLCILAVTPLLSLWMTDIRSIYPAYFLWGRSAVRLALAALLYWLRPRHVHWEPIGNF